MKSVGRAATLLAAVGLGCCVVAPSAQGATSAAGSGAPAMVSTGHSAWSWGSPTPQGQNLDAVVFQGVDGYAVGAFGTIVRSADAGQTWTGLPSGTTDDLDLVQELSPATVVAAGGCSVVESTDSGASFRALPLGLGEPCDNPVAGIAFSDPQHGYVELGDGTLLYTADGGASLQAKSSPPLGGGSATGIAFSSPTTGLAVSSGGVIERTTDGANSWAQVEDAPHGVNGVTIVSPTLAFAVGDDGELLSSTDGGVNWASEPLALHGGGSVPDLESITCADADNCLIATSDSGELVRTSDGGQTGVKVSVSNQALTGVAYSTGSTVIGVGAQGATVISDDAGQTFPVVTSSALSAFSVSPVRPLSPGLIPGSAYQAGQPGIAATTDYGASWSLLRVPGSDGFVDSVAFASKTVGYALDAGGVLHRTTNGGSSWSSLTQGHSALADLAVPSARTVLVVGTKGIDRSTDAGASFHKVGGRLRARRHRGAKVASLHLNAALVTHGAVVAWEDDGGRGPIVVSTNAGRSWRAVPEPPHDPHGSIAVSAVSPSRLWFVERGQLWATSDAGRHWHPLPSAGHMGEIADVSFSSRRDGIAAFNARLNSALDAPLNQVSVLRTTNGGRSWAPEIIAGQSSAARANVLATPVGDLTALAYGTGVVRSAPVGFFTTARTRAPARQTRLTVRFAHRKMSARALARAHHRVLVTGHVSPVLSPQEAVAVSFRIGHGNWRVKPARVASNGAFRLRLTNVHTSATVVAQEPGTSSIAGAGTPAVSFAVRR